MPDYAPLSPDGAQRTCECGCGVPVSRRFVNGHNRRGQEFTSQHRAKLSAAMADAWVTKRQRKPLGSRRLDVNGYWLIKVREGGGRWDKEHVLVVQEAIGRLIAPGEHVHHINGVKTDNRLENLHLCTQRDHARAHGSFAGLLPQLMGLGLIEFDRESGVYRVA